MNDFTARTLLAIIGGALITTALQVMFPELPLEVLLLKLFALGALVAGLVFIKEAFR